DESICVKISSKLQTLSDGKTLIKGVHHCRYDYFPDSYTEVHDSTRTTYYQGNPLGLLDKTVIGGSVSTVDYREDGFVMAETNELGHTTVYTRDSRGRVLSITGPLGDTTHYHRDGAGLVVAMTDAEGHTTDLSRDERGNLLTIQWPDDTAESREYDTRGLVTQVHAANGASTRLQYDGHANLTNIAQPNGGQWRYEHDGLGRRLSATNPIGAQTTYSYTSRGDLVALRDAIGGTARYSYDGDGQLLQYHNPKGAITKLRWAGLHKLVARVDANRNVVLMRYNHEGELVRVINEAGEQHQLHRDMVGTLTGETTFDGRELRYRYDLAGQVVRTESGAQDWTDFSYDAAGRLIARELDDGTEETFAYNARGELIRAESAAGTFRFERDALGRTVREAQTLRDKEHWVDVTFDANGERIRRTTSLGHREEVLRDAMGARTRTLLDGDHEVTHSPDVLGRETARTLANGGRIESHYDPLGRLSKRLTYDTREQRRPTPGQPDWVGKLAPGAGTQASYRYDWDGELIGVHDTLRGNTEYQYDPVGQLLAMVPEQARKELFKYDKRGNLAEAGGREESRVYGKGNRLERKDDTHYVWDDDGRLIEKRTPGTDGAEDEVWRYRWNGAGLLEVVDRPDGGQVQFKYDPFARRVSKTLYLRQHNGVLKAREHTRFVWDGDVLAHEIYLHADAAGDPIVEERTYLFEDESFVPLAHKQGGRWVHYVNDQIGTPERLIDEGGAVVCEMRRTAWGRVEVVAGATADTPLRFQGQYADEETGLSYNRWRYFDAEGGRFTSADPIGLHGGQHGYRNGVN
ncbi:MAG TPA: RHS repeat protein, partial [Sorangium sp.]|nr:RHS repeat protein [Sorangium sp.]